MRFTTSIAECKSGFATERNPIPVDTLPDEIGESRTAEIRGIVYSCAEAKLRNFKLQDILYAEAELRDLKTTVSPTELQYSGTLSCLKHSFITSSEDCQ